MNRFGLKLHAIFLYGEGDFGANKREHYPSATQTPEVDPQNGDQVDAEEQIVKEVQEAVSAAQEDKNALNNTVLQTPDFSNTAGIVASEISTKYTDMEQLKTDHTRFQERLKSKNNDGKGEEYTKVWEKKITEGYNKLIKSLEENKYFDDCKDNDAKNKKIQDVLVKYSKEVNSQYEKYIWSAGNKTFNRVKDTIFGENTGDYKDYPAEKIYNQLTGATSISRVDREYTEGYESDILDWTDIDDDNESLSERKNRNFLADDLTQYLWNIRKTPGIINALNWLPIFTAKEDRPSKVDRKAIKQFLKVSSKIEGNGNDKALSLMEVFRDSSLKTNSGKDIYKEVLAKHGVKVEDKYIDDIVKAGSFYVNTQKADNSTRDQHAIYLSVLKIIETEGGVDSAVKKFKSIVEQGKQDKKTEKKEGYESGEKLGSTNPELYEIAKNLGITDFASATRLSEKNAEYFANTPVEKILANLNNDRTLDARDSMVGGSKSGNQFLGVLNYVGKEKALKNLVEHAKLLNKTLGVGLPDALFDPKTIEGDIKSGHTGLILLLQDIINKPGEDLYTLLSGHSENPFEGIDLTAEKASADKAAAEMIKKMDLEALKKDGLTLPTPESMQSGLATALYTEYKRGIGLGGKVSFDQWIKGVELNTGFQVRNDGTVMVGIGLDYRTKIDLGKGWSTTPELSAGGFIPLGMGKPELSGSAGLNNEVAKERITKKGIKEHLGVQGGITRMPAGVFVLSAGFKWEQDKAAGIESAEQKKMVEFRDKIMGSILTKAFEKRKMIRSPFATKIDFNSDTRPTRVETFKEAISEVAKSKDEKGNILVPEDKQEMVTNAVMRLLVNYNNAELAQEGVKDIIAQQVAEEYAMAWAEDRKAHISDSTYLSGANLGAFWVAGSPLVGIYAGIKFTKHGLDGYGDRWGDRQEVAQEYQGEWNQEMINRFNQQLGLSGDKQIKLENGFVVIPAGLKHRVNVNEKMHGLMMKDKNGNILLHTQTPMATDVKKGAATQGGEVIIGGRKGGQYVKLDNIGPDRFVDDKINEDEILKLGEGLTEYNLDVLNKAIMNLNEKIPGKPLHPIIPTDIPTTLLTTRLISKLNEISKKNKKAKITIINENGKIEFKDPVEGEDGRGLELQYESKFDLIDSKAKDIANAVYEQVLKLDANGVRILNSVKHDVRGKKHWEIYDTFNNAILEGNKNGNYANAKDAIKPIFGRLIKDCKLNENDNGFKKALDILNQLDGAALGQALMSIDNIFARSIRVVGKNGEYTFPREGAEGMSKIIADREKGISKTIEEYFKDDIPTRDAYLALIKASQEYRKSNLSKFEVTHTKAKQLNNTVGFNLGDKTNPERPLFNPEIYQEMIDFNAPEFQTEELKNAKNTIHKRAMEKFANNKALMAPILKTLGLEGKTVKVNSDSRKLNEQDQNKGEITLDIGEGNDKKEVKLSTGMKFGYFTQCVNHTIILDDITIVGEDGTSVTFNSGVWDNGTYREGNKSSVVSTTEVGVHGSVIVHNEKPEPETEPETEPEGEVGSDNYNDGIHHPGTPETTPGQNGRKGGENGTDNYNNGLNNPDNPGTEGQGTPPPDSDF